jgi:hypothetical protein
MTKTANAGIANLASSRAKPMVNANTIVIDTKPLLNLLKTKTTPRYVYKTSIKTATIIPAVTTLPGVYSSQYGRGMGITVSTELSSSQRDETKLTKTKPTKNQNKDLTFMMDTVVGFNED